MTGSSVLALQQALAQLGYDPGTPDGSFGAGTTAGGDRLPEGQQPDAGRAAGPHDARHDQRSARARLTTRPRPRPAQRAGASAPSRRAGTGRPRGSRRATRWRRRARRTRSAPRSRRSRASSAGARSPRPWPRAGDLGRGDEREAVPRHPDPAGEDEPGRGTRAGACAAPRRRRARRRSRARDGRAARAWSRAGGEVAREIRKVTPRTCEAASASAAAWVERPRRVAEEQHGEAHRRGLGDDDQAAARGDPPERRRAQRPRGRDRPVSLPRRRPRGCAAAARRRARRPAQAPASAT